MIVVTVWTSIKMQIASDFMLLLKSLATSKCVDPLHKSEFNSSPCPQQQPEMMITALQDASPDLHEHKRSNASQQLRSSQSSVASFTSSHYSLEQVKDAHYHNRFPLVSEDGWRAQFIKTIASEEGNEKPLFVLTVVCDFKPVWPLLLAFSTTFSLILPPQYLAQSD